MSGTASEWRLGLIDLEGPTNEEVDPEREEDLRRSLEQAQRRVGGSGEGRVRWLLRFAALDFSNWTATDPEWAVIAFEILAFTMPTSTRSVPYEQYVETRSCRSRHKDREALRPARGECVRDAEVGVTRRGHPAPGRSGRPPPSTCQRSCRGRWHCPSRRTRPGSGGSCRRGHRRWSWADTPPSTRRSPGRA